MATLSDRVRALEEAPRSANDPEARAALERLAHDLAALREGVRLDLSAADAELARLGAVVEEISGGMGGPDPSAPLTEADEPRWVVRAADPDPGVRFSALVRLGRARTERSVQASLVALDDAQDLVAWQAVRNLGSFRERGAARVVARLLGHASPLLRLAAYEALVQMGAPADTGFDPLGDAASRARAAAALAAWADEP